MVLKERANAFLTSNGVPGWEAMNASKIYDGEGCTETAECGYMIEEYWNDVIDLVDIVPAAGEPAEPSYNGIAALGTAKSTNSWLNSPEYSSLSCAASGACTAVVYNQRNLDSVDAAEGYRIEVKNEMMYDFIGWYVIYDEVAANCDAAEGDAPARLLADADGDGIDDETGEAVTAEDDDENTTPPEDSQESTEPVAATIENRPPTWTICGVNASPEVVTFVLGAYSGIAAASTAILSSMLF